MANITISGLCPDESFLTDLESNVLTASIVGGSSNGRSNGRLRKMSKCSASGLFGKPNNSIIVLGVFINSPLTIFQVRTEVSGQVRTEIGG